MPRALLLFLFLFIPFTGCYSQNKQLQNEAVKQDNFDTWDFGRIKEGEIVKHIFTLKNESAKIMNIKNITSSCGCTASEVKKKTLLPAESTDIEVQFNSKGYEGAVSQYIYVNTDNPDKPILKFIIKAEVAH